MNDRALTVIRRITAAARVCRPISDPLVTRMFCLPLPRAPRSKTFDKLAATGRAHRVGWRAGSLRAWEWEALGARRGRVLLTHGWGGRAASWKAWIEPLRKAGFDVVAYDSPAHGDSPGKLTHLPRHARGLVRVAEKLGPFDALVGHSLGAMATALTASGTAPVVQAVPARRIVLIAGPNRVDDMFARFSQVIDMDDRQLLALHRFAKKLAGRDISEFEVREMLERWGGPTFVIHDEDDDEVPVGDAEAMAQAQNVSLLRTEGLGHRRVLKSPEVIAAALAFLTAEPAVEPTPAPRLEMLHRELAPLLGAT